MDPLRQGGYRVGEEGTNERRKQADVTASSVPRQKNIFTKSCDGKYIARSTASIVFIHAKTLPHLSRRGRSASGGCRG